MAAILIKLKRFIRDERGNIAIMGATSFLMIIACAALGIDVGAIFADKRRTQSAADLAAIVAASDLNNASRAAAATVARNNYPRTRSWLSSPVFTRRRRLSRRSSASWRARSPPMRSASLSRPRRRCISARC
jgi:hypothetical protein